MDKKKIIIGIISLVVLLAGVAVGVFLIRQQQDIREKAAPASTIKLTPAKKSVLINEAVDLTVEIDTTTNKLSGAVVEITYDPQKLNLQSFTPGTFLTVVFEEPKIDATVGKATVTLGAQPANPPQGKGVLATLKFVAKELGSTDVSFGINTLASGTTSGQKDSGDILVGKIPSKITILASNQSGAASPTPPTATTSPTPSTSPSTSPKASPVATPTATATPATGGTASPTPSTSPTKPTVVIPASGNIKPGDTISGTAVANSTVTIKIESQVINATVKADSSGKWSYKIPSTLEAGDHTITVTDSNGASVVKKFKVLGTASTATPSAQDLPVTGLAWPTIIASFAGVILIIIGTAFVL